MTDREPVFAEFTSDDILEKLEGLNPDFVSCALHRVNHRYVRVAKGKVLSQGGRTGLHAEIFMVRGDEMGAVRVGPSALEDSSSLKEHVEGSLNRDRYGGRFHSGLAPSPRRADVPSRFVSEDPRVLLDLARSVTEIGDELGVDRVTGILDWREQRTDLASTSGVSANLEKRDATANVRAWDEARSGQGVRCGEDLQEGLLRTAVEDAVAVLQMAPKSQSSLNPGQLDLVLGELATAEIIYAVSEAASNDAMGAGRSFLEDRTGDVVGSELLTLRDDPTGSDSLVPRAVDDVGHTTSKLDFVSEGRFTSGIHNVRTAAREHVSCTGHCGVLAPSMWHVKMQPGDWSLSELIEEVGEGVYLSNLWYTRFQNYSTGTFSTVSRDGAFEIVDGEVTGLIQNLRVVGNVFELLRGIRSIGVNSRHVRTWTQDYPVSAPACLTTARIFSPP